MVSYQDELQAKKLDSLLVLYKKMKNRKWSDGVSCPFARKT